MFLGFISKNLSLKNRNLLGKKIGWILRILSRERSEITLKNITDALPEYDSEMHIKIRNESYQNLGITLVELLAFPVLSENDFKNYLKFENIELVKEKIALGNGLIFISGHFGNWELMAYVAGLEFDVPVTLVVKHQSNDVSDKYLHQFRTQGGNKIVHLGNAARTLLQTIKKNEAIALLVDQSADWKKDIFVDFFGKPAVTYEAPAVIALKYRTPIITCFAHRQDDCTYKVVLNELDFSDLQDSRESVIELTKRHVKVLEDNIRANPGLWAWQHKRWKHDPPAAQS
jgi:KDO2-lipid IV(A) lauroyltransferase